MLFGSIDETKFIHKKEYVDRSVILQSITQEKIFSLVFGFEPVEGLTTTSPFRKDNNPGCIFKLYNNTLYFIDWANSSTIRTRDGKVYKMQSVDCFSAVQIYYDFSYQDTLVFINNCIKENNFSVRKKKDYYVIKGKINSLYKHNSSDVIIKPKTRLFVNKDVQYWKQYGITLNQLIEDNINPVYQYDIIYNDTIRNYNVYNNDLCYQLSSIENRTKLYFPRNKKRRFLNTYRSTDIGCINSLDYKQDILIVTKSYKDCRVLRNQNLNSIWFQSENIIPDSEQLITVFKQYKKVFFFFDNDDTGITGSINCLQYYQSKYQINCNQIFIDKQLKQTRNIKDISDMYRTIGVRYVKEFINNIKNNL